MWLAEVHQGSEPGLDPSGVDASGRCTLWGLHRESGPWTPEGAPPHYPHHLSLRLTFDVCLLRYLSCLALLFHLVSAASVLMGSLCSPSDLGLLKTNTHTHILVFSFPFNLLVPPLLPG